MMKTEQPSIQQGVQPKTHLGFWIVLIITVSLMMPYEAAAETIYSYFDDQGNLAWTDNYNNIPERYRAKVKTTEGSISQPSQTTSLGTMHTWDQSWRKTITGTIGGLAPEISGLSLHQSKIATAAGLTALICVIAMYMSRSQVVKFLSLWVLILLGIATPVLIYTSEGNVGDIMKDKTVEATKNQQNRLQQAK